MGPAEVDAMFSRFAPASLTGEERPNGWEEGCERRTGVGCSRPPLAPPLGPFRSLSAPFGLS